MTALSDYRTGILTILGDVNGRRYSEAQLDMALRQALTELNRFLPEKETVTKVIEEMNGLEGILDWVPDPSADILTIRSADGKTWYNASDYRTGGKTYMMFYGKDRPAAGASLLLELTVPYTVKDLESANQTTVPDSLMLTVCSGAAGYAMRIRARSVTEVFGKRPEDTERLIEQAETLINEYLERLIGESMRTNRHTDPWPYAGFPI